MISMFVDYLDEYTVLSIDVSVINKWVIWATKLWSDDTVKRAWNAIKRWLEITNRSIGAFKPMFPLSAKNSTKFIMTED